MKQPSKSGTPIDTKRIKRWLEHFGSYRTPVTRSTIENWLEQFAVAERDVAARVLDVVEFFGQAAIYAAFRQSLKALSGWNENPDERKGKWRFAAMSGSAGESGDGMLYHFRVANQLDSRSQNELFIARRDILGESLGEDDTVVLLDDFSGTGKQVCDAWLEPDIALGELLAGVGRVYLLLVAASQKARDRIADTTSMSIVASHELGESDSVFSDQCTVFSSEEKAVLLKYGKKANRQNPKGYGECGYLVVFQHRTPNNTIPILHAQNDKWLGIFPRHI